MVSLEYKVDISILHTDKEIESTMRTPICRRMDKAFKVIISKATHQLVSTIHMDFMDLLDLNHTIINKIILDK